MPLGEEARSVDVHIHSVVFRYPSRMLRIGHTLVSRGVFDEVCFLATYAEDLPREQAVGERQRVLRLGAAPAGRSKATHLMAWMREVYRTVVRMRPACINVHSLTTLPLGVLLKVRTGARLIYDTHELESKTASAGRLRQVVAGVVERALMPFVDHTFVVCESIGEWYRRQYGIENVTVIKNYPSLRQNADAGIVLRERIGAREGELVFLYQGRIGHGRGVKMLLDAFSDARVQGDGVVRHVVFMGEGPLQPLVEQASRVNARVHYLAPVQPSEVLSVTRQADVALCVIEPVSESYRLSLPNKLLESLSVSVPVVASDLVEMRRELEGGRLGWLVRPELDALLDVLVGITVGEVARRREALLGWHASHNWEEQEDIMAERYQRLAAG